MMTRRWTLPLAAACNLVAAGLMGCHQVVPPQPAAPVMTVVAAPLDTAWDSIVRTMAANGLPIRTIDKASGLLATTDLQLDANQRLAYIDCGTAGGKSLVQQVNNVMRARLSVTIYVHARGTDSTAVQTRVVVQGERMNPFAGNQYTPQACRSNGRIEASVAEAARG